VDERRLIAAWTYAFVHRSTAIQIAIITGAQEGHPLW
jgi:hypothetical protein